MARPEVNAKFRDPSQLRIQRPSARVLDNARSRLSVQSEERFMAKAASGGPGTRNNPQGIPKEASGGSNAKGGGKAAQNTNTKGSGAQKRQQKKKR